MAEVGQETNVSRIRANQKADWIIGIVRHGESVHDDIARFKRCACAENPAVEPGIELVLDSLLGEAIAENRDPQLRA